jgi:hypothetical protein
LFAWEFKTRCEVDKIPIPDAMMISDISYPRKIRLIIRVKKGWQKTIRRQNAILRIQQKNWAHSTGPHNSLPAVSGKTKE